MIPSHDTYQSFDQINHSIPEVIIVDIHAEIVGITLHSLFAIVTEQLETLAHQNPLVVGMLRRGLFEQLFVRSQLLFVLIIVFFVIIVVLIIAFASPGRLV